MRKKSNDNKPKICPLLDENCIQNGCAIYNEMLERCEISLLAYNLFLLAPATKQNLDAESRIPRQ